MLEVFLYSFTFCAGAAIAWAFRGLIQRNKDELKAAVEAEAQAIADKIRGR